MLSQGILIWNEAVVSSPLSENETCLIVPPLQQQRGKDELSRRDGSSSSA